MRLAAALTAALLPTLASAALAVAPAAAETTGGAAFGSGGSTATPALPATPTAPGGVDSSQPPATPGTPVVRGAVATVGADGLAAAPAGAPAIVRQIIAAGNAIARKPDVWGGGHRRWVARGYDCSGSVSFALHGAGLLDGPLVSGDFARWGAAGPGSWVTIYANGGHVFMIVAGLRFDTSGQRESGSRWQAAPRRVRGFKVRHPVGL